MNPCMMRWPLMAEAGEPGGGGAPAEPPKTEPGEPPKTEPPKTEPPKTEPGEPPKTEPPKTEPPKEEPKAPVNLLDDEPEPGKEEPGKVEPTDEERKAFVETVKKIDIGEGVTWDDPALEAIAPSLMELTGGDATKADGIVKAYTAYQQAQAKAYQERQDAFLNGLVSECQKRFGADLKKVCALAKAGGQKVFGDKIWNVMRQERSFANNPDIIEKLAAIGRSATDDPGVVKKEAPATGSVRDWRTSMYGKK